MKYIMYQTDDGQKLPIIFPSIMVHRQIDQALRSFGLYKALEPINAGEIYLEEVEVFGKSETMKIVSNADDKLTIETWDTLFGY